jgi:hypothetical protein
MSIWRNKKFGARDYKSSYENKKKDRSFVLTAVKPLKKNNRFVAESHEAAKKLGWKKIK